MNTHVHAWMPGVAPEYLCECGAVGLRRRPSTRDAAIVVVAETPEDAALRDRGYEMRAEADLAESEGRLGAGREPDETLAVDDFIEEGRMGTRGARQAQRHAWSASDEDSLRDAVAVVFADDLPDAVSRRLSSWSAVAGRLLPDLVVTPDACRTRWGVVLERERAAERAREQARLDAETRADEMDGAQREAETGARVVVEPDAWEALRLRIEEYEANEEAEITASLAGIRDVLAEQAARLGRIEAYVAALAAAWDVTP